MAVSRGPTAHGHRCHGGIVDYAVSRIVFRLVSIPSGRGRGHPLSRTWETWMAPNVTLVPGKRGWPPMSGGSTRSPSLMVFFIKTLSGVADPARSAPMAGKRPGSRRRQKQIAGAFFWPIAVRNCLTATTGCGSSQVSTDGRKEARIATTLEQNRRAILPADRGEELPHGNQEPGERAMNGSHEGFSGDCDAGAIGSRLPRRSSRAQQNENSPMFRSGWCRTPNSAAGKPVLGELPRERREASAAPRQSRGAMDQESR